MVALGVAAVALLGFYRSIASVLATAHATDEPPVIAQNPTSWRRAILGLRLPTIGCFTAVFPRVEWKEVACVSPPPGPFEPTFGPRPFSVGDGEDFSAGVATRSITAAEGSFDSVTGVASETGQVDGTGPQVGNAYTLQLNTAPFATPACTGSPNPSCKGWQQFLYESRSGTIFIQYWLEKYNASCPAGWKTFMFPHLPAIYCWKNGPHAAPVGTQPITNLVNLRLDGKANPGGSDTVIILVGNTTAIAANLPNVLGLGARWRAAEFMVGGDGKGGEANFNAGSTLVVRTTVHNGTPTSPTCLLKGFTAETNNLNLVGTAAVAPGPAPAIVSAQSNVVNTPASCSAAQAIGDTHLTTFSGLLYDFQATGDFVLADSPPNFLVQTRQISGAPTWPDAAVNSSVATRIGPTQVALCLPNQVQVDGRPTSVTPGRPLVLPGGVDVSRTGNTYLVRGPDGETVRAQMNPTWIDVFIGLGRLPSAVRGLLANANGNAKQLVTSAGTVLTEPISFETLYDLYGQSWRVEPGQSLLCGKQAKSGEPSAVHVARARLASARARFCA